MLRVSQGELLCGLTTQRLKQLLSWETECLKVINKLKTAEVSDSEVQLLWTGKINANPCEPQWVENVGTPNHSSKTHLFTAKDTLSRIH